MTEAERAEQIERAARMERAQRIAEIEAKAREVVARIIDELAAPFPPEAVKWRVGSTNKKKNEREGKGNVATRGQALAYIDSRDIMRRFDAVVGANNWKVELHVADQRWVATLYVRMPVEPYSKGVWEWIGKSDAAGETDVEPAKGGASDAIKRAAVHWGPGRSLYDLDSPWVDLNSFGNGIAPHEMERLDALIRGQKPQESQPSAEAMDQAAAEAPEPPPQKPPAKRQLPKPTAATATGPVVTEAQRKLLFRTTFQTAEKAYKQKLERGDKRSFEPLNHAMKLVGVKRVDECPGSLVTVAIGHMNNWLLEFQAAATKAAGPLHEEEPPPPDEGYYSDEEGM